ncbi:MAG: hypothetical protein QCH99_04645 [Candidatus Bathyarchaeota archaeon]|nr:hypothetical protein [Candidatus Bathyarchaeum tardum]WGM90538.1 MAG: hypothetical protein NUK63_05290 [Candidatus Bathyarchaeum tardum]
MYRAPLESKARSAIPRRLKELGCQQLHRAFWKIEEKKMHDVLKVLENNQPVVMKRLREIKNPKLAKKKAFSGLGSLVVVTFTLPKGANREKVTNFLRKAPCIRLRRSVYAFSQKRSFYEKQTSLVDALKFVNFIRDIGGNVKIISRVVILNPVAVERLLDETKDRIETGVFNIVSSCKKLYVEACRGKDYELIRGEFSRLKRRYLILKKVCSVYTVWLKIDFTKILMRAYHALRKVNTRLEQA